MYASEGLTAPVVLIAADLIVFSLSHQNDRMDLLKGD